MTNGVGKGINSLNAILMAGSVLATSGVVDLGFNLSAAKAQTANEIIVTARKREESILEVPFALSAFSEEDLEEADLNDFTDLDDFTPGFSFENANGNRADRGIPNIVIRGLNLQSFSGSSDAALLFVDGAPVFGGEIGSFTDVERVEVLRGPQSAYFGRNTFSGAVNLVTKEPGDEFGGKFSAEYGRFGTNDLQGSLEGPIVPGVLSARVSARRTEKAGHYINNATGERDVGDELTKAYVGTVVFRPADFIKFKFRGMYAAIDDGPNPAYRFPGSYANCDPTNAGINTWRCGEAPSVSEAEEQVGFQDRFANNFGEPAIWGAYGGFQEEIIDPFSLYSPDSPFYIGGKSFIDKMGLAKRIHSWSATATIDLPQDITFDWITSWARTRTQGASDENMRPTGSVIPNFLDTFLVERYSKNISHEARLTSPDDQRIRWLVGANLIKGDDISSHVAGLFFAPTLFSTRPILETETFGIFGGLYFDLTEQLTISGELRYQSDRVSVPSGSLQETFNNWGPRITLEYEISQDVNLFANWSQGFRPGSFNSSFVTLSQAEIQQIVDQTGAGISVDPEKIKQWEAGVKGRFGMLSGSLVGYYGKITDQQVQTVATVELDNGTTTVFGVLSNLGAIRLYGIELEAALQATDQLRIQGTFGWNHTEYTEGECRTCVSQLAMVDPTDVVGNRLSGAPAITGSFVGVYTAPLSDTFDGFLRAEYLFEGTKYASPANLYETGSRHRANLRAGVNNGIIRVEAYVTNIFNDKTYDFVNRATDLNTFGNGFQGALPDKRAFGVRASYQF